MPCGENATPSTKAQAPARCARSANSRTALMLPTTFEQCVNATSFVRGPRRASRSFLFRSAVFGSTFHSRTVKPSSARRL